MIPYGRQDITETDIDSVIAVLRSDYLTQGPVVPRFEQAVAAKVGARYAVASNSATSALHCACMALDLGPGDRLWTSPNTFVASANCALYCGASVDFVDIDPRTYNLSVDALSAKLENAERTGTLPKVVVPVHYAGQACEMQRIAALSLRYGFRVIEDASHAIGGRYRDEPIGNGRYSDITVFSFHPVKIITTGEGGMALTNDPELANRLQCLRSHGVTSDPPDMHPRPAYEIWNYQQIRLGYNYRMTDIHAALGISQLARLDDFVTRRHVIARRYDDQFAGLPLRTPWQHPDTHSSYHLYPIRLSLPEIRQTQRHVYNALHAAGILVNLHYIPVHRQPYFEAMGFSAGYCLEAEQFHREVITIPIYAGLTDDQQDRVISAIGDTLKSCT
jgi:UDP-4-amino-4,6-dideoxy-N-acetyl-beta-L-altrosamine transaminase